MGKNCKGYSIWLMPKGIEYMKLSNLILKLSKKYDFPHFHPHVTLIGMIKGNEEEIIKKTEQLASQIKPYNMNLFVPDHKNEYSYFKSIFLEAAKTKDVMAANTNAQEIFNRKEEYGPHLSICYGKIPMNDKITILSGIKEYYFEFEVDKLHLFQTAGGVEKWYKIREFPLSGKD